MPYDVYYPPRRLAGEFQRLNFRVPQSSTPGRFTRRQTALNTATPVVPGMAGVFQRTRYAVPPYGMGDVVSVPSTVDEAIAWAKEHWQVVALAGVGLFLLAGGRRR